MRFIDIASYKCRESRFFRENPPLLENFEQMLAAVLHNLEPLLAYYNLSAEQTFNPNPTRPPSHAAGWLVKRVEAALRVCEGYDMPWADPDANSLLERWLHSAMDNATVFELVHDSRLEAMITQVVRAMYESKMQVGELLPAALDLKQKLQQEPYKTIKAMQQHERYAPYNMQQLGDYLAWQKNLHAGEIYRTSTELALLYTQENHDLDTLCRFLRAYGNIDKAVMRKLQQQLACAPTNLLQKHGLEPFFPAKFLLTDADQFLIFQQLSGYKIAKSRFYRAQGEALFRECFDQCLAACMQAENLLTLMIDTQGITSFASVFATFLFKRIEQRLREMAGFPFKVTAEVGRLAKQAHLAEIIDEAVIQSAKGKVKRLPAGNAENAPVCDSNASTAPVEPPKPVSVDFTRLDGIRKQAAEMTERLIVEEEENEKAEDFKLEIVSPVPSHINLFAALSAEQIVLVNALIDGTGTASELEIEAINELALDIIGDNLIEGNQVYPEYIQAWKEGTL